MLEHQDEPSPGDGRVQEHQDGQEHQHALESLRQSWTRALQDHLPPARALREELHADPHVSGDEGPAAEALTEALGIPLESVAQTGRIGRIGPAEGPSVLLRAELDALPVPERTGVAFAAENGAMHACGHDVHQAALVAVVRAAAGLDLPVGLVPLLQPREETYPSGARDTVESGALERLGVAAAIGAHVHPHVPVGSVATGAGVVNAAADEVEIVVAGHGGHGAYPHHAADPVAAISHIALALPEVLRRTGNPMRPSTLSVGHLLAGDTSANVLPAEALLRATLRTTHAEDRAEIQGRIRHIAQKQAEAFGLEAHVEITHGEPVLYNDPDLVELMDRWLERGGMAPTEPMRSLGADDFSYFAEVMPSVMSFVGVTVEGHPSAPPLHHPEFLPTASAVDDVATALISGYLAAAEHLLTSRKES